MWAEHSCMHLINTVIHTALEIYTNLPATTKCTFAYSLAVGIERTQCLFQEWIINFISVS